MTWAIVHPYGPSEARKARNSHPVSLILSTVLILGATKQNVMNHSNVISRDTPPRHEPFDNIAIRDELILVIVTAWPKLPLKTLSVQNKQRRYLIYYVSYYLWLEVGLTPHLQSRLAYRISY